MGNMIGGGSTSSLSFEKRFDKLEQPTLKFVRVKSKETDINMPSYGSLSTSFTLPNVEGYTPVIGFYEANNRTGNIVAMVPCGTIDSNTFGLSLKNFQQSPITGDIEIYAIVLYQRE